MKYRDYLILPAIIMYVIFASCAFIQKNSATPSSEGVEVAEAEPTASVNPSDMSWGNDQEQYGEYWYAEGTRKGDYFSVEPSSSKEIYFYEYADTTEVADVESTPYVIRDMHMLASTDSGRNYDLIFLDEMTAYDCVSGTYFERADYDDIKDQLTSGKFVNTTNDRDYYVFKNNGSSCEYFGDQCFNGDWTLDTTETLCVYDHACHENFHFNLIFDSYGKISGFTFNEILYTLS